MKFAAVEGMKAFRLRMTLTTAFEMYICRMFGIRYAIWGTTYAIFMVSYRILGRVQDGGMKGLGADGQQKYLVLTISFFKLQVIRFATYGTTYAIFMVRYKMKWTSGFFTHHRALYLVEAVDNSHRLCPGNL